MFSMLDRPKKEPFFFQSSIKRKTIFGYGFGGIGLFRLKVVNNFFRAKYARNRAGTGSTKKSIEASCLKRPIKKELI
jgi:hypothetical protein